MICLLVKTPQHLREQPCLCGKIPCRLGACTYLFKLFDLNVMPLEALHCAKKIKPKQIICLMPWHFSEELSPILYVYSVQHNGLAPWILGAQHTVCYLYRVIHPSGLTAADTQASQFKDREQLCNAMVKKYFIFFPE